MNPERGGRWIFRVLASVVAAVVAVQLLERRVLARLQGALDDAEVDEPAPLRTRSIPTGDGGHLHIEEGGAGPPIVLLHGHGATSGTFSTLAPRLAAQGHRVIAVDQRGFGRSSPIPDWFGFRGLVDDVATVIRDLDLAGAIVVGHSLGGAVALGLVVHHPDVVAERVRSLVLLNSTARGPADDRLHRAWLAATEWSAVERLSRHPRHGVVLTRTNFGAAARRRDVEAARQLGLASPVDARRGFARRLLGTDLTAHLGSIDLPVLVLGGAADRVVPARESTRLAGLLPNASVEIFPGAGHMLPMERADAVAERIVRFARSPDA